MVLGHLTVTAAARDLLKDRLRPVGRVPPGLLILGAYVPDIVDKPVALVTGLPGRGYGHSIVILAAVFLLASILLPRHRTVTAVLGLGAGSHLLEDWVEPRVLLAPLLGPIARHPGWSLMDSLFHFYRGGGPQVWIEVWALLYWVLILAGPRGPIPEPDGQFRGTAPLPPG